MRYDMNLLINYIFNYLFEESVDYISIMFYYWWNNIPSIVGTIEIINNSASWRFTLFLQVYCFRREKYAKFELMQKSCTSKSSN